MAERLNAVVLKTIVPHGTGGSNPSLSAKNPQTFGLGIFLCPIGRGALLKTQRARKLVFGGERGIPSRFAAGAVACNSGTPSGRLHASLRSFFAELRGKCHAHGIWSPLATTHSAVRILER